MDFAVLFDMDGVLVENHQYHIDSWKAFSKKYQNEMSEKTIIELFGNTNRDYLDIIFQRKLTVDEYKLYGEEKEALYREMYANAVQPVTGLIPFLEMLKQHHVKTAVATSASTANLVFVLDKLQIAKYFDALLDITNIKRGKPDPEIYLKASQAVHQKPEKCLVIEDSFSGIKAGKHAGMKVIGMATTHSADKIKNLADWVVSDYTMLDYATLIQILNTK
jgi:beta-phosphoglucomutase